jgi:hypothetical protein
MRVFPVRVERVLDVPVERSTTIPGELKDPAAPRRGQVREKATQDRRRAARWDHVMIRSYFRHGDFGRRSPQARMATGPAFIDP